MEHTLATHPIACLLLTLSGWLFYIDFKGDIRNEEPNGKAWLCLIIMLIIGVYISSLGSLIGFLLMVPILFEAFLRNFVVGFMPQQRATESKTYNYKQAFFTIIAFAILAGLLFWIKSPSSSASQAPLKIGFRESKISGLVLQTQNTSDEYLSCKMAALNDTQKEHVVYSFSPEPQKITEIGIMECGWAFQHGEKILISTEGYKDLYFTVP